MQFNSNLARRVALILGMSFASLSSALADGRLRLPPEPMVKAYLSGVSTINRDMLFMAMIPGAGAVAMHQGGRLVLATYADFFTHLQTRVSSSGVQNSTLMSFMTASGLYLFKVSSQVGSSFGSFWGHHVTQDSNAGRSMTHCFPSATEANSAVSAGNYFLIAATKQSISDAPSVNRNGFLSTVYSPVYTSIRATEFTYWDVGLGKARTVNPYTTGSYSDYTGV